MIRRKKSHIAPAVLGPERFRPFYKGLAPSARTTANDHPTFQRVSSVAVRLPERFRGGCAFGADVARLNGPVRLSRDMRRYLSEVARRVNSRFNGKFREPLTEAAAPDTSSKGERRGTY